MDIRGRLIAPCATLVPDEEDVASVDIGALVLRMLLFETYILESMRLLETRALIRAFGFEGLLTLLQSGVLKVRLQAFSLGQFPQPPGSHRVVTILAADQRSYVSTCFKNVAAAGISVKNEIKLKRAYLAAFVPGAPASIGTSAAQAIPDDLAKRGVAGTAVAQAVKTLLSKSVLPERVDLKVHPVSSEEFRLESNLRQLCGCDEHDEHRVLERAALAVGGLNQRLGEMRFFNALSGFLDEESGLIEQKLDFLLRDCAPGVDERRCRRVVTLAGLPDVEPDARINTDALLRARESREIVEFRAWLRGIDEVSDVDVAEKLSGVRARIGLFMTGATGKSLRLLATTALGLIPGAGLIAGFAGSASDSFLLERMLPTSGPTVFLSRYYAPIFSSPVITAAVGARRDLLQGAGGSVVDHRRDRRDLVHRSPMHRLD